jgi:arginine utilization protein RocB
LKSVLSEKYALKAEDLKKREVVENNIAEHVIKWLIEKLHKKGTIIIIIFTKF